MKTKLAPAFPVVLIVLLPVIYIMSLVVNMYVPEVHSLLSDDGIRWTISHPLLNFASVPLASILLLMMTIGVLLESGVFELFRGRLSLKQRRAIVITGCVMAFVLVLLLVMLLIPDAIYYSPLGSWNDSALSEGLFGLVLVVLAILGNVYGFASGRFVTTRDFIYAHRSMFVGCASYFVTLFLSAQVVCSLEYSNLLYFCSDEIRWLMKNTLYYLPLVGVIVKSVRE